MVAFVRIIVLLDWFKGAFGCKKVVFGRKNLYSHTYNCMINVDFVYLIMLNAKAFGNSYGWYIQTTYLVFYYFQFYKMQWTNFTAEVQPINQERFFIVNILYLNKVILCLLHLLDPFRSIKYKSMYVVLINRTFHANLSENKHNIVGMLQWIYYFII